MIKIGSLYRVMQECGNYSLDVLPHKSSIAIMAGETVKVLGDDNNGSPSFRSYKIKNSIGNIAWCWARELEML